jgi:hypothetical protein
MLAANSPECLPDRGMLGIERVAGNATSTSNSRNPAAQRRHRVAFTHRGKIGSHHFGSSRHRDKTVPAAPGLVVREVGRTGPQGRRSISRILVGLRLGECARRTRGRRLGATQAGDLALARLCERRGTMLFRVSGEGAVDM